MTAITLEVRTFMLRSMTVLTLCVLLPAIVGAQTVPDRLASVTLPHDLARVLRDYERAWEARDAAGLAALFTPDGFVLSPGNPPVRGRDAIERAYTGSGGPLALRALAYAVSDTVGYIIGAYARERDAPDVGKFVLTVRQRADGRWMIAADMDNGIRRP